MVSDRAKAMIELNRQGWSTQTIAREYGIGAGRVAQLMREGEPSLRHEREALDARAHNSGAALAVEHAGMGTRATNALRHAGLTTLGDVADAWAHLQRAAAPNFGKKSIGEIGAILERFGVRVPSLTLSGRAIDVLAWNGFTRTSQVVEAFVPGGPQGDGDAALAMRRMTTDLLNEIRVAVAEYSLPARVAPESLCETWIGVSRAIRRGGRIVVSGTAPIEPDGSTTPGDVAAQAERVFAIIAAAIETLGGRLSDVVHTRTYIVAADDAEVVKAVHARWLGDVRPTATMVVVASLLRPEWRVEIEAEAMLEAVR